MGQPLPSTTPEYKKKVLLHNNIDPEQFDLTDAGDVVPKVVAQPTISESAEPVSTVEVKPPSQSSATGAFGRSALASTAPTLGGLGAAGLASLALAPETGGLSLLALLGVGAAGLGGTIATSKAQDALLPDAAKQQLAADQQEHPIASTVGGLAPSALMFNPVKGVMNLPAVGKAAYTGATRGFKSLEQPAEQLLKNTAVNVGMNVGSGIANQGINGQPLDAGSLGIDALSGLLFNEPTSLGKTILPYLGHAQPQEPVVANAQPQRHFPAGIAVKPLNTPSPITGEQPSDISGFATQRPIDKGSLRGAPYRTDAMAKYAGDYEVPADQLAQMEGEGGISVKPRLNDFDKAELEKSQQDLDEAKKAKAELNRQEAAQIHSDNAARAMDLQQSLRQNQVKVKPVEQAYISNASGDESSIPKHDYTGVTEQNNVEAQQESAADLEARRLEGNKGDKYQNEPANADDNDPYLLRNSTPQYKKAVMELAAKRGITLKEAKGLVNPATGKEVLGKAQIGDRVASVNPNRAELDTPVHETQHIYLNDLLNSADPQDRALAKKGIDIFGGDMNHAEEALTTRIGVDGAERIKDSLDGSALKQFTSWFKDFTSRMKVNLGVANDEDVVRHLGARLQHDAPYGTRSELGARYTGFQPGFGAIEGRKLYTTKDEVKDKEGNVKIGKGSTVTSGKLDAEGVRYQEKSNYKPNPKDLKENQEVFNHQNDNGEQAIGSKNGEWHTNQFRYRLENAGDILREFSKYPSGWFSDSYINEKINGVQRYIDGKDYGVNPTGERQRSIEKGDGDRIRAVAQAYKDQPTVNSNQEAARQLAVSLANGDFSLAQKHLDHIKKVVKVGPDTKFQEDPSNKLKDNPNFKKWFGESKVVDKEGNPLVVYHGTDKDFTTFKEAKEGTVGKGIYASTSPDTASAYTTDSANGDKRGKGGNVIPLHISIENPLTIAREDGFNPAETVLRKLGYSKEKASAIAEKALETKGNITGEIQSKAKAAGYDGIIIAKAGNPDEVVAFHPTQVKSAIGNKGTYDSNNPDIRYQEEPNRERIVATAVKTPDGSIFHGSWHGEAAQKAVTAGKLKSIGDDRRQDGFVTNKGKYLTRDEASDIISNNTGREQRADYLSLRGEDDSHLVVPKPKDLNPEGTRAKKYLEDLEKSFDKTHPGWRENATLLGNDDFNQWGRARMNLEGKRTRDYGAYYGPETEDNHLQNRSIELPPTNDRYQEESSTKNKKEKKPLSIPLFKPELEKIRDNYGEHGKVVASALEDFYENFRHFKGEFTNDIVGKLRNHLNLLNPKELATQNNESLDRVRQYMDDTSDGHGSDITLTPQEKEIEGEIKSSLLKMVEAKNSRPGLPSTTANEKYFPHVVSRKALNTLFNKPGTPESKALIKDFFDYQKSLGNTEEQAKENLEIFRKGYQSDDKNLAASFGPIDKSAGVGIPQSWREKNLIDRMSRFANRYARRIAYHDSIETNKPATEALTDPVNGIGNADVVRGELDNVAGKRENEEAKRNAVSGVIRAGMIGPLSGAKDFVTNLTLGLQHQTLGQALTSPFKAWSNIRENLADSFKEGVNRHNFASLEFGDGGIEDFTNLLRTTRDVLNEVQGRNFLEKITRATAFGQGKFLAMDNLLAASKGRVSGQGAKFLEDFASKGIDWKQYREKGEFPTEVLNKIAARYVESVQGTYDSRGLPAVAQKGSLAPILSLAKWNVEKMNNFVKHNVEPARNGNFTPLLMSTLGMLVGGEAIEKLVEEATGRKSKTATVAELKNAKNLSGPLAYKLAALSSMSGYAGIMGDITKSLMDKQMGNRAQGYTNPLVEGVSQGIDLMSDVSEAVRNGDLNIMPEVISKVLETYFQSYRLGLNQLSPDEKQKIDKSNKLRDLRVFKQTQGLPQDSASTDEPNPFKDLDVKEFKQSRNPQEAAKLLPGLIQKALKKANGNPEVLKSELQKLKENSYQTMPSPERMPITFISFLQTLRTTQGDEAATERLMDYMKNNAVNRAKSSLVPSL